MGTYLTLDALTPGDVVCLNTTGMVLKAIPSALASLGRAFGVSSSTTAAGALAVIQTVGAIPAAVTGLAAVAGPIRVSSAARCELVTALAIGDFAVGTTNSSGLLTLDMRRAVTAVTSGGPPTRAAMQAILVPTDGLTMFVAEVDAPYRFDATSSATADSWTVLTANDATPGRWLLQGETISLSPIGGTSDDWARLFGSGGVAAAMAYKGKVSLRAGTWLCKTLQVPPSGTTIVGNAGVEIRCSLSAGSILNSPFAIVTTDGVTHTIAVNNTPGSDTIRLTASPAGGVGSYLRVSVTASHLSGSTYRIVSITPNGGNFDVKLDRAVVYSAEAGVANVVTHPTQLKDIRIIGNGMRITGTCESYVECCKSINCDLSGIVGDATTAAGASVGGVTFDTFSAQCNVRDLHLIGPGSSVSGSCGMWLIGEDHRFENLTIHGWATGIIASDMIHHDVCKLNIYGCGVGMLVTADGALGGHTPSHSTRIVGGTFWNNVSDGLQLDQGSTNIEFIGCNSRYNGSCGLTMAALAEAPKNVRFTNCAFQNNTIHGFQDIASASGIVLESCDISNNGQAGLNITSYVRISNLRSAGGNPTAIVNVQTGAFVDLVGYDLTIDTASASGFAVGGSGRVRAFLGHIIFTAANGAGFNFASSSKSDIDSLRVTFNAAATAILSVGGSCVVSVENVDVGGSSVGSSIGLNQASGSTFRVGRRVDVGACGGGPFNHNSGAFWSRSLDGVAATHVVANGATGVDVTWPDLKLGDRIHLTRVTDGGTPGPTPRVTKTVGTKFTITATAGDTSTYAYVVS